MANCVILPPRSFTCRDDELLRRYTVSSVPEEDAILDTCS